MKQHKTATKLGQNNETARNSTKLQRNSNEAATKEQNCDKTVTKQ